MFTDFVYNGAGYGSVGSMLAEYRFDPGFMKPYYEDDPNNAFRGRPCVTINTGRRIWDQTTRKQLPEKKQFLINELQARGVNSPVFNATALRKEEWIELDRQVLRAARYRLRAWSDLAARNSFGGFNAMTKMILEHETMTDPGEAMLDFDGLTEGRRDQPKFQLEGVPLPIVHSDFWFSSRFLGISRNSGTPLDSTMGEAGGRRCGELIEKLTIGIVTGPTYGGNSGVGGYSRNSTVYGYLNFSPRITKTGLYIPTGNGRAGTGWVPKDTLKDVLAVRQSFYNHKFSGPFMAYHSNDWDQYLDDDYTLTGGNVTTQTLRNRLRSIDGVEDVRRLDFLFSSTTDQSSGGPGLEGVGTAYAYTMIFVQMTPDVARAINGMGLTTIQWESKGGMQLNFKVMGIMVPQLRADTYGNCGICQATFNT